MSIIFPFSIFHSGGCAVTVLALNPGFLERDDLSTTLLWVYYVERLIFIPHMDEQAQAQDQQQQEKQVEPKPGASGTYYGELSPEGQWFWEGTGQPDDQWIANSEKPAPEPLAAPTPGTAILATATIDSLFTLVYGTRSADLSATPTYSWATGNSIIGQWPAVLSNNILNNSCIVCRFEARAMAPSTITQ